ncbi:hypothetical protein T492DRAFT_314457 [Pavlovales sp. CCMP2436]|nr:hypothetical protein T492DRAFT_314457 [Pavlovales sp. CCMP2436]
MGSHFYATTLTYRDVQCFRCLAFFDSGSNLVIRYLSVAVRWLLSRIFLLKSPIIYR